MAPYSFLSTTTIHSCLGTTWIYVGKWSPLLSYQLFRRHKLKEFFDEVNESLNGSGSLYSPLLCFHYRGVSHSLQQDINCQRKKHRQLHWTIQRKCDIKDFRKLKQLIETLFTYLWYWRHVQDVEMLGNILSHHAFVDFFPWFYSPTKVSPWNWPLKCIWM